MELRNLHLNLYFAPRVSSLVVLFYWGFFFGGGGGLYFLNPDIISKNF